MHLTSDRKAAWAGWAHFARTRTSMGVSRTMVFLALVVCFGLAAQAQTPDLKTDSGEPLPAPAVSFDFVMPATSPPHYALTVGSTGLAAYRSDQPAGEGEPYIVKFTVSGATRDRVFQLARELNYFQGNFDYTKSRVANTGAKTLTFRGGTRENKTTYNYSQNPKIQELTNLFQNISTTLEFGRRLEHLHRYDRLGLDAELKNMESAEKAGRLAELQAIEPVLSGIAKDHAVMNVTRRRAEGLLARIQPIASARAGAGGGLE